MFAGRTLPGVSESREKGKKITEGNGLLCQGERKKERRRKRMGKDFYSSILPLVI